ncbi:TetR/AcrR family transcriptional regulator [Enterococcus timonensis]|uniref:TetR/AcrR family transcriptional regulator n=1 Tax=Enterococcus timonensis TaxID=1852364 RepID=UPI0008D91EDB|nr:TetR/AcrR family transcriptional regulator [Enterococcus timonensis]
MTREDIIKAGYELVAQEGFHKFTARNIAKLMGTSTAPIYAEFHSMDALKETIFQRIENYLGEVIFNEVRTGDSIVDMGLNYIYFAMGENKLYKALYLEDYGGGERMHNFSYRMYTKRVSEDNKYQSLSKGQVDALHYGTWIIVTGLASLMSSHIIMPTEEQLISIIKDSYEALSKRDKSIFD